MWVEGVALTTLWTGWTEPSWQVVGMDELHFQLLIAAEMLVVHIGN